LHLNTKKDKSYLSVNANGATTEIFLKPYANVKM